MADRTDRGSDRLPPLPPQAWNEAQRREAAALIAGPRGRLLPPFVPLLRSPELLGLAQRLGEYLRYRNALGPRLTELAILLVARHWSQPIEWALHRPIAIAAGIDQATIVAIEAEEPPPFTRDDEQIVHDFCIELLQTQQVSDPTWAATVARFGETAVVDLIGTCGYYAMLAMVMNAARTPVPES